MVANTVYRRVHVLLTMKGYVLGRDASHPDFMGVLFETELKTVLMPYALFEEQGILLRGEAFLLSVVEREGGARVELVSWESCPQESKGSFLAERRKLRRFGMVASGAGGLLGILYVVTIPVSSIMFAMVIALSLCSFFLGFKFLLEYLFR